MRNAIGLAFAIAAAALVGVDNHSGLAQEQAKVKLAPPQPFNPHSRTRSASLPKVSAPSTSLARLPLTTKVNSLARTILRRRRGRSSLT